ncbi:hypothetical protein KACHI17_04890 [Sediminibacterium sp. KACHI17]|uniref:Uncharacterized protein n=1 Tax=Sediminibacterium sp. KACHI17 TaxID=1751071 RepID=A0AAT9GGA7_9BACT
MSPVRLDFIAKWTAKIIVAVQKSGSFVYEITDKFIPISEVRKPYNVNPEWNDDDARKALLSSDAVDLVSSFTGTNTDLTALVVDPKKITHSFFSGDGNSLLQEGDAMLILVPQM